MSQQQPLTPGSTVAHLLLMSIKVGAMQSVLSFISFRWERTESLADGGGVAHVQSRVVLVARDGRL